MLRFPHILLALVLTPGLPAMANEFRRPAPQEWQGRSPVIARNGVVATSQPLAAEAGVAVLKEGGNAVDAAIATNAVLGVVEPMSCGIGGDIFVIYWDATTQKLYGLNGSGRAPAAHTLELFAKQELDRIPTEGPLSWSVPGCVDGWHELHRRFGKLSFEQVLAPAIEYAEHGFPVSPIIAKQWAGGADNFEEWPTSAESFLIDGRAPKTGEIFKNPGLAESYRQIAKDRRKAFYGGAIADKIVATSEMVGGHLTLEDLSNHKSEWVEPLSVNYRGYDVWELPPNGQGISVLQMLNVLSAYDLSKMGRGSAEYLHLLIEAKKLAFADRAKFYADPSMANVPVTELISKEYAVRQRRRIDPNKASVAVPPGKPMATGGETIYLSVVDGEGNCCSLIQSTFHNFGSGIAVKDGGFFLQNRGALFCLDEKHANCLAPGKRPFHTIIPAMVTKEGKPWLCFGVMGGDMQPQGHVQVLVNMIDFGLNVQAAGEAARVRHEGSATPTGDAMAEDGGTVYVEPGISDATIDALRKRGHIVERDGGSYGGYQGIWIDPEHGTFHGGSDPRKDGAAIGY